MLFIENRQEKQGFHLQEIQTTETISYKYKKETTMLICFRVHCRRLQSSLLLPGGGTTTWRDAAVIQHRFENEDQLNNALIIRRPSRQITISEFAAHAGLEPGMILLKKYHQPLQASCQALSFTNALSIPTLDPVTPN